MERGPRLTRWSVAKAMWSLVHPADAAGSVFEHHRACLLFGHRVDEDDRQSALPQGAHAVERN